MITDNQTNTVYFSNLTPEDFPKQFNELNRIITSAGFQVKLLAETYDFYCRDYMPVQVGEDDFVQFVFRPKAYFEKDQYYEITNPILVGLVNKLEPPRFSHNRVGIIKKVLKIDSGIQYYDVTFFDGQSSSQIHHSFFHLKFYPIIEQKISFLSLNLKAVYLKDNP